MDDLSVGASGCSVHCGKTADRVRMPFGVIGRTGPGMRQVGDRSTGRGTFGGKFGARHCNQWGLNGVRVRQCRDAALSANYFWANLLLVINELMCCCTVGLPVLSDVPAVVITILFGLFPAQTPALALSTKLYSVRVVMLSYRPPDVVLTIYPKVAKAKVLNIFET